MIWAEAVGFLVVIGLGCFAFTFAFLMAALPDARGELWVICRGMRKRIARRSR